MKAGHPIRRLIATLAVALIAIAFGTSGLRAAWQWGLALAENRSSALELPLVPDSHLASMVYGPHALHLPIVTDNYTDPALRLSRFGVSHVNLLESPRADFVGLRIGYHWDFTARQNPVRPGGIAYSQVVRLDPKSCFSYRPSGAALEAIIDRNPGALWFIGNEPDRIQEPKYGIFQDDIEPQCYARAYAHLYRLIKGRDPTARIAAGNIVQATPVRLRYLNAVLRAYREQNRGAQMPVDVWSIHGYILPECPDIGWGAKMPPGVTDATGCTRYEPTQNADVGIFGEMVHRFRQWMRDNGYRETPLYMSEFGVLMPSDILGSGEVKVGDQMVLDFMQQSIDFMRTATSNTTGYPADGNRLVQRWAWYSHVEPGSFNGHLFDPVTKHRTVFGDRYAAITAAQPATVNLYAWKLWTEPASGFIRLSQLEDPVRIYATIVNNGNVQARNAVTVQFYDGNPGNGGVQIGATQYIPPLDGGASLATVSVPWTPTETKTYELYVRVDPFDAITETNPEDNTLSASVKVVQHVQHMLSIPIVVRAPSSR